ncbi:cytochrome b/b6 domain-containing protein [Sansalvadorimonas sp. 2012CJ34-2]|uniref:Cytochrome b/b6 domain-containing protein n=1 Tax=Parendozoicomonas callyspongiae TaxID=2942213 RepID=A0ABT0PG78_9GAMM|nr:cytochrome b/b6 domain-containing protein [Sansalvadorimonas sp. 2012CJ34-2]MCL6270359.1 cytochrome b/b6 domain-containing protein [Sansalvadorimonas sp. 2012CJ34-2]
MDNKRIIRVWDLPTRLFHWLLVLCFAGLWYTGKDGDMERHFILGFTMVGLILFRIGWGFAGGHFSRFKALQLSPSHVLGYLRKGLNTDYPGHNPLGSWAVVALLTSLSVQVGTGLFANDSILTEGPLVRFVSGSTSDWLTTVHSFNFDILLGLIGLHIAAVLFHSLIKREDLIQGMITGKRKVSSRYPQPDSGPWEIFTTLILFATMVISWLTDLI